MNRSGIQRIALLSIGIGVVLYAIAVIIHVSSSYELGIRTILTPHLVDRPANLSSSTNEDRPVAGDLIKRIGFKKIDTWKDILQSPRELHDRIEDGTAGTDWYRRTDSDQILVVVEYVRSDEPERTRTFECELRRLPLEEMIPSLIWLFLKGALFVIGALVYWKRPDDESAVRFYILCVVTLGAYIGGYHWTHIVTQEVLQIVFIICAILLPVASLHFYLVFPRKKVWLERYPRGILTAVYGLPLVNLACVIAFYCYSMWIADADSPWRPYLRELIFVSFGIAACWYLMCMAALLHSMRTVEEPVERKQVRCVLFGVFFSHIPIGYSLYIVLAEPANFVEGAVTWPMFGASLIVTIAFAIGMTRYRLLEVEKIITSSVGYFLVSFLAGLFYYGVVLIGTLFYSQFMSPTLPAAVTVSTTALIFVLVLDAMRSRIQRALDRRFSRSKSQLDQTLQQMSQAVSQLVDPPVLAQRLLSTVADTLGSTQGAVYLREDSSFRLAASLGETPGLTQLHADAPLIEALENGLGLECPASAEGVLRPAQDQLRQLRGEVAQPLCSEGKLLAVLVLGPKDAPFRAEDWTLLSAFAQITVVALESAAQHRTIEQLNQELQTKVDKIAEQQQRIFTLQTQLTRKAAPVVKRPEPRPAEPGPEPDAAPLPNAAGIVGSSPVVRQLLTLVRKVAATDAVVLLRGESGTGKELLARAVHENSPRAGKPYVKVHCAALTASLLESELFGHVKGAFTGAHKDKLGRFEMADGGTLFLDEIGDISIEVQTKLLRVLQEKTIERVGASESTRVDVRIIAATHQNLESLIRQGRFREDLFYRLNVFPIEVPALRERSEDIAELAAFFVTLSSQRCKRNVTQIDDDALALLKSFDWPGNIRQLENVIERAVVIAEAETLTLRDMPAELFQIEGEGEPSEPASTMNPPQALPPSSLRSERDRFEREQVTRALADAAGNKAEAARILGIARSTLVSRLKKLGLE